MSRPDIFLERVCGQVEQLESELLGASESGLRGVLNTWFRTHELSPGFVSGFALLADSEESLQRMGTALEQRDDALVACGFESDDYLDSLGMAAALRFYREVSQPVI